MTIALAMLTGAMTSAAWVAPRPWCFLLGLLAFGLFSWVRIIQ